MAHLTADMIKRTIARKKQEIVQAQNDSDLTEDERDDLISDLEWDISDLEQALSGRS